MDKSKTDRQETGRRHSKARKQTEKKKHTDRKKKQINRKQPAVRFSADIRRQIVSWLGKKTVYNR